MLSLEQSQQVEHIAKLSITGMCLRAVAAAEFEASPEVGSIRFTVHRTEGGEAGIDAEVLNTDGMPLGGFAL